MARDWSHAALHAPLWGHDLCHRAHVWAELAEIDLSDPQAAAAAAAALCRPVDLSLLDRRSREQPRQYPFSLALPFDFLDVLDDRAQLGNEDCEGGRVYGRLTAPALAGLMSRGDPFDDQALLRARELVAKIAAQDWAWADAERLEHKVAEYDETGRGPDLRDALSQKEKLASEVEYATRADMRAVLAKALEHREGQRLDRSDLNTVLQLAARLAVPLLPGVPDSKQCWTYVCGWQLCERCDTPFEAQQRNARRCKACRRRKPPKVYSRNEGGWHIGTHGDPTDGTLVYLVKCECGAEFSDYRASQRLCHSCRNNAGRVRRHRQRKSEAATDEVGLARLRTAEAVRQLADDVEAVGDPRHGRPAQIA